MGRPPLHPSQRRTALLKTHVKPQAKAYFHEIARKHGYDPAMALREAAIDWIKKKEQK